jgi:hypothetical protein
MKKNKKYKDFFESSDSYMNPESAKRADKKAEDVISFLKLAEARKKMGLRQIDLEGFSQADVSKIENRSDIKLSTLIDYMQSIGMGIKISGLGEENEEFEILKVGNS